MILMNDFKAEPQELRDAMSAASRRVIDSGWYILGEEVTSFEKKWATTCGVAYGVGVGNGMDAIEIALRSLNVGCGDEVITTSMTAFATVLAILRVGAVPVLADINPETALLSLESVKRCTTKKTKALVLVHLYGQIQDMNTWVTFCDSQQIFLIEDCAQAHLAKWNGSIAGSFGIAAAYSFYPTKNLGAVGDAGILITDDLKIAEQAKCLRNYGQGARYEHPELGMNSRLDEIQAAILSVRLEWLLFFTKERQKIADSYRSNIRNTKVKLLASPKNPESHVNHLFVLTCKNREKLQKYLSDCKVQTLIHYPTPVHLQQSVLDIKRDPIGLAQTELHAKECLSIPCHPFMSKDDTEIVINAINNFQ